MSCRMFLLSILLVLRLSIFGMALLKDFEGHARQAADGLLEAADGLLEVADELLEAAAEGLLE